MCVIRGVGSYASLGVTRPPNWARPHLTRHTSHLHFTLDLGKCVAWAGACMEAGYWDTPGPSACMQEG